MKQDILHVKIILFYEEDVGYWENKDGRDEITPMRQHSIWAEEDEAERDG